jgi:nitric oxide reductase NorE protein
MSAPLPDFLWADSTQAPIETAPQITRPDDGTPGEPGVWIFILGDMSIFGAFFVVFLWENRGDRKLFAESTQDLFQSIGAINTLVLLLSSYLVVLAVRAQRAGRTVLVGRLLLGTLACAATFAALKAYEYSLELGNDHTPGTNVFFTFYFVLTGVHLIHVLIGACLVLAWRQRSQQERPWLTERSFAEGCATYWHMVDLLWIVIFTLLYLVCVS